MYIRPFEGCCGATELTGVSGISRNRDLINACSAVFNDQYDEDSFEDLTPIVVFTDARVPRNRGRTGGERLYNYIRKNRLGIITKSREIRNPETGNMLTCYTWLIGNVKPEQLDKLGIFRMPTKDEIGKEEKAAL